MSGARTRVAVFGGGVGGLSAAHELVERGFDVDVYERRDWFGGKARSTSVPGSGTDGRPDLPGEHGFRFFPRFYRHVTDTMTRIPFGDDGANVASNLCDTARVDISSVGKRPLPVLDHAPRSFGELLDTVRGMISLEGEAALKPGELEFFVGRLWRLLTSCEERRLAEYERQGWWDFIDAEHHSHGYRKFLGVGLTRSLVAARARQSNAKATGEILIQLLLGMGEPGVSTDRVLCGPTNDVWITPWHRYLEGRGVGFHADRALTGLELVDGRIRSATVTAADGTSETVTADFFVLAVPVECAARLFAEPGWAPIVDAAPELRTVADIAKDVAWMNGLQFYLRRDVPVVHGHILLLDSPWAVTAISQQQFWPRYDVGGMGDGTVHGILSVDISNWTTPGTHLKKPAEDATVDEIVTEVWQQVLDGLNGPPGSPPVLEDADRHSWYLDPDIATVPPHDRVCHTDAEPLFLSLADTWRLRPEAATRIPNLVLASDYVRTFTQLPTMEGANEAARRAVNAVLAASGSPAEPCELWALHEPVVFSPFKAYDRWRFRHGKAWNEAVPGAVRLGHFVLNVTAPLRRWWHRLRGR